ncbi:hypothetical protein ABEB36_010862 [Hypothenemus hampei]|uniref:Endothelin-converting enzyme 1 n=1 Tax=Hypothenemus hampei TaxID=57062 RepID=A0ABD1EE03_HYPHA
MKKYMNPNVDPCENFYEFACGNWRNYHDVPPDKITYDTFEIARDNLYFVLKTLLETQTKTQTKSHFNDKTNYHNLKDYIGENYQIFDDSDAIDKAKKFYKSCMNEDLIEKRAEKPLKKLLEELGGWPIITSNWEQSEVDLIWVLSRLRLLNNAILISQWIGPDIKDSNKHIIHIDQTTLGLPNRAYFLDETNSKPLKAYKSFILSIAKHLGAETSVALQDVDDIVDFETKLASVMTPLEERRNISQIFQRIQIRILIERYPYFNWHSYFSTILEREIDLQSTVACYCPDYIHNLLNLLNKTNPRIIQNYLLWRFIKHRTSNLDSRFLDSEQKFYHALFGIEKRPPRWKFCVSQTNTNMGMAVGALFVQNYFDENSKTDTIHITQEIMETFINSIEEKLWLDEDTKRLAKLKIKNMDLKIGFPDFLFNSTEVNLKYQDVKIEENFFFENVLSVLRHTNREGQKKFGLLVNKSQWNSPPAIINAYYSRSKNQIMFPAGILQPPFYHKHFPKSINFGGIGVIIGHEITHALDDKGRLFDHEGNLQFWWDNKALVMFYERSQCIIDQYGNYILPESNTTVDGILTQGENIADNGGLKQAFKAYKNWLTKNPEVDETLPDLDLDGPQLFFLNFAQAWCGKQRIESERNRIKTSVHSPGIFRVIGALSNSDEFSMVYNCSKNSPMNPVEKCDLW